MSMESLYFGAALPYEFAGSDKPYRLLISFHFYCRNDILCSRSDDVPENLLIVAHNAVNQALIGTALGLQPYHFRRLVQSNAAATIINILPDEGPDGVTDTDSADEELQKAFAILDGLNETPEIPLDNEPVSNIIAFRNFSYKMKNSYSIFSKA